MKNELTKNELTKNELTKNELTKKDTASVVKRNLDKNRDAIIRTLPAGFNYDRMCRSAINAISTVPSIARCTPSSVFLGIVRAFSLGLEPNGALNEGYLVPFKNKGVDEAVFMPSYRGLINLARRSGKIAGVYAKDVRENDDIEITEGTERSLRHNADWFGDRGEVIGYYAVYETNDGVHDFEVMNRAEIEKIRESSKAKNAGPWVDWYDEMAKKTVIKRLLKRAPMSVELAKAVELDHKAATGEGDVLDIEGIEVPNDRADEAEKSALELDGGRK